MQICIKLCCRRPKCDLAFVVRDVCYSVTCFNSTACHTVKAHKASEFHPQVAFIFRGLKPGNDLDIGSHKTLKDKLREDLKYVPQVQQAQTTSAISEKSGDALIKETYAPTNRIWHGKSASEINLSQSGHNTRQNKYIPSQNMGNQKHGIPGT
ncbi:predicted protein, partial [Nematostella vectensis]